MIKAVDKASKELGAVEGALGKLGAAAKAAVVGSLAIGAGLAKMAVDAAPLEGIKRAFDGLTASIDGGSSKMLAALQKSSKGMIDNRQLMLNFNLASQLVNREFAERLPEAMEYLTKVSAATGQSMDYLMNSLILGVGRLSPRIIDNLAVQISATEAYEKYAASIGKAADELTRQEQQTAMMNLTMEKLKENTASFPDITDNATTKLAQFHATLENIRDGVGMGLLPVLKTFMDGLNNFATALAPGIIDAANKVGAAFFTLMEGDPDNDLAYHAGLIGSPLNNFLAELHNRLQGLADFASNLMAGGTDPISALLAALNNAFGGEFTGNLKVFGDMKYAWDNHIKPILDAAVTAIATNVVPALQKIGNGIGEFFNNLRGADPRIFEHLRTIAEGIILIAGAVLGGVLTGVGEALPKLGSGIRNLVDALSAWSAGDSKGAMTALGSALRDIGGAFLEIPAGIADALINALEKITGMNLASADQVLSAIGGALGKLKDSFVAFGSEAAVAVGTGLLINFLSKLLTYAAAGGLLTTIRDGILAVRGAILALNPVFLGAALGFIMWETNLLGARDRALEFVDTIGRAKLGWMRVFDPEGFEAAVARLPENILREKFNRIIANTPFGSNTLYSADATPISMQIAVEPEWVLVMNEGTRLQVADILTQMGFNMTMGNALRIADDPDRIYDFLIPVSAQLDIHPIDLLDQIMRALVETGNMAGAGAFFQDIVLPITAKLDEPELTQEFVFQWQNILGLSTTAQLYTVDLPTETNMVVDKMNIAEQFSRFIREGGASRIHPAEPVVNTTVQAPLPPITEQFRKIVSLAAAATIFAVTSATGVRVTASSVDLTSFISTVRDAIVGALADLGNFLTGAVANMQNTAASAGRGGGGGLLRDEGGRGYPGQRYRITSGAGVETFVPDSAGTFYPHQEKGGGDVHIHFEGSGGPRDEAEAQDQAYLLTTALRVRGIPIGSN